jgi:hypothetical protein
MKPTAYHYGKNWLERNIVIKFPAFLKKKQRKKYEKNIKQNKNKSQKRKETKTLL